MKKSKVLVLAIGLIVSASAHAQPDGLTHDMMWLRANHPDVYAAGNKTESVQLGSLISSLFARIKNAVTGAKIEETKGAKTVTAEQPSQAPSQVPSPANDGTSNPQ